MPKKKKGKKKVPKGLAAQSAINFSFHATPMKWVQRHPADKLSIKAKKAVKKLKGK